MLTTDFYKICAFLTLVHVHDKFTFYNFDCLNLKRIIKHNLKSKHCNNNNDDDDNDVSNQNQTSNCKISQICFSFKI